MSTPRALKNFSTCSWPSGLRHTLETSPLSCMEGSMPSPSEGRLAAAVVPPTWVMTFFMSRVALYLDCVVTTDLFCLKAFATMRCKVLSLRCWILRGPVCSASPSSSSSTFLFFCFFLGVRPASLRVLAAASSTRSRS